MYKKKSRSVTEISNETMPLTIFYRGTVAVFDLPRDKVGYSLFPIPFPFSPIFLNKISLKGTNIKYLQTEAILKLAETANAGDVIGGTEGMRLPEGNQRLLCPVCLFNILLLEIASN